MEKNKITFEKDEKKSILIALIVSVVLIFALILAFVGIKKYQKENLVDVEIESSVTIETEMTDTYDGNVYVRNQDELNEALENELATAIMIESKESQTIVIPAGDYSKIALVIDAPYTEITNYGVFESILIKQISTNTWTESAMGNTFTIDAPACHMIIPSGITANSMECVQPKSTLALELQGTLPVLAIKADSSIVSVQIDGELSQLSVKNTTSLKLSGSSMDVTPVEIGSNAANTILSSKVPVNVTSYAQVSVEFLEGAEGSQFFVSNEAAEMLLTNNTKEVVVVTKPDEKQETVSSGKSYTYKKKQTLASSDSSSTGNSSSNSGSSSTVVSGGYSKSQVDAMINQAVQNALANADKQTQEKINQALSGTISKDKVDEMIDEAVSDALKDAEADKEEEIADAVEDAVEDVIDEILNRPVIIEFVDQAHISAGTQGNLIPLEEMVFPTEVYGRDSNGTVYTIAVKEWQNTDHYSVDVTAGKYTFTAVLESSTEYYIANAVQAYCTVMVKPTSEDNIITYKNAAYSEKIKVTEYRMADYANIQQTYPQAYYLIENISQEEVIYASLKFYYYDGDGNLIEQAYWNGQYIQPGNSWIGYRSKPCMDYAYYVVEIDNFTGKNGKVESFAELSLTRTPSIEINKTVTEKVSECNGIILYLDTNGNAYGIQTFKTNDVDKNLTINDTSKEIKMTFNLTLPNGADIDSSIVVWRGGYK